MINQRDVARVAGVSVMTVSRVINNNGYVKEATKTRVHDAIKSLNYHPNNLGRSLINNRVNIVAVLAPILGGTVENDPYFTRLLTGIESILVNHSYDLLLSTQRMKQIDGEVYFDYFRPFLERKADALILMGAKLSRNDIEVINKNNITFCVIGDRPFHPRVDIVDTKNREGMKIILDYIYNAGHRKIAFGGYDENNFNIMERYRGYKEFLEEKNLEFRKEYIFHCSNSSSDSGKIIRDYLNISGSSKEAASGRPTAIACSTDNYAISAIRDAQIHGISIPEELSISGFDGNPVGRYIQPRLTSMLQPTEEMGRRSAEFIMHRLSNPLIERQSEFFDATLLEGDSVSSPILYT